MPLMDSKQIFRRYFCYKTVSFDLHFKDKVVSNNLLRF